ncbi:MULTISPECIES: hypothetical protein [unclassified Spiroplasma]|uniref:hypothetical protein n=1 Tax=unclassified Spiroplasma TaxID=2637901 RepID=UPI0030CDEA9F
MIKQKLIDYIEEEWNINVHHCDCCDYSYENDKPERIMKLLELIRNGEFDNE